jgi:DNA (cytosine-5)-methyltransferase 1
MIRYADLFCGLGAFHQSFKKHETFRCVLSCDIDEGARRLYHANHGVEPLGDVRSIEVSSVPELDLLCAGFPCQSFSIAGLKKGFDDGDRGNLFYEILRLVDGKKPRMVVLENVKNLRSHDNGNTYKFIEKSFVDRGYSFSSKVMDSAYYGSPQCRQRIFMVAVKDESFSFPERLSKPVSVSSILDLSETSFWDPSRYKLEAKKQKPKPFKPRMLYGVFSSSGKGGRQGERIYDPDCCGVTVCASSGGPGAKTGLYSVGGRYRRLNVSECLRMFGFPKSYDFLDMAHEQRIFYLGNSIVVDVVDALLPEILRILEPGHI